MKNYIMSKEKLKEVLLGHKTFFSQKCRILMEQGVDIYKLTYQDTNKFTDEYIDTMIQSLEVDKLLDQVDEVMEKTLGFNSKDELAKAENRKLEEK